MRKVQDHFKTALFCSQFKTASFRATTKTSLNRRLLSLFCYCFFYGNNIHLWISKIHIKRDIAFPNQDTCIFIPFDLNSVLTKKVSVKVAYKPCLDNFRMFPSEYFCPNHQRYARKITPFTRGALLFFTRLPKYSETQPVEKMYDTRPPKQLKYVF